MTSPRELGIRPKSARQNITQQQFVELQRMQVQLQRIVKASAAVVKGYERMRPHLHTICVAGEGLLERFMRLLHSFEGQAGEAGHVVPAAVRSRRVLNPRAGRRMACGEPGKRAGGKGRRCH